MISVWTLPNDEVHVNLNGKPEEIAVEIATTLLAVEGARGVSAETMQELIKAAVEVYKTEDDMGIIEIKEEDKALTGIYRGSKKEIEVDPYALYLMFCAVQSIEPKAKNENRQEHYEEIKKEKKS